MSVPARSSGVHSGTSSPQSVSSTSQSTSEAKSTCRNCRSPKDESFTSAITTEVEKTHLIIKKCGAGMDGITLFAIPVSSLPGEGGSTPLLPSIVIVKMPGCRCAVEVFLQEMETMRLLRPSPHLVRLTHMGPKANPYFVMDYVRGSTLLHYLRAHYSRHDLPPAFVWKVFTDLLNIVISLRGKDRVRPPIVHGDLHLTNLMLDESLDTVVIDFGRAIIGPRNRKDKRSDAAQSYKRVRGLDLSEIAQTIHRLAHSGMVDSGAGRWSFRRMARDGKCKCTPSPSTNQTTLPSDQNFGPKDGTFISAIIRLSTATVNYLSDDDLAIWRNTANHRREIAERQSSIQDMPKPGAGPEAITELMIQEAINGRNAEPAVATRSRDRHGRGLPDQGEAQRSQEPPLHESSGRATETSTAEFEESDEGEGSASADVMEESDEESAPPDPMDESSSYMSSSPPRASTGEADDDYLPPEPMDVD